MRLCAALLAAALLAAQAPARADSACWPEADTLGHRASALLRMTLGGPYPVATYGAYGQRGPLVDCRALHQLRGGCDQDYAIAAVDAHASLPGLARMQLANGAAPLWVRAARLGQLSPILPVGREGQLLPADAVWRAAPSSHAAAVAVAPHAARASQRFVQRLQAGLSEAEAQRTGREPGLANAYTVMPWTQTLARVRHADGEWFRVSERLAASVDGGLSHRFGPVQRVGYLLHRDRHGRVQAVIQDDYCD